MTPTCVEEGCSALAIYGKGGLCGPHFGRRHRERQVRDLITGKRVAIPARPGNRRVLVTTCPACGLLLEDAAFRVHETGRRMYTTCRACQAERTAPPTPAKNAENSLRRGGALQPPRSLPYRYLARSCPSCHDLLTTPDELLRRDAGPLPRCSRCSVRSSMAVINRKREANDEAFRRSLRRNSAKVRKRHQQETADSALRGGKMWTGPELETAARDDLSSREVALLIGRTLYAVKHIRRKLKEDPRKWNML